MRFNCTINYKGEDHEVSATCYVDYDGIGKRWIAVEDIECDSIPNLSELSKYELRDVEELIAHEYDGQDFGGPDYD